MSMLATAPLAIVPLAPLAAAAVIAAYGQRLPARGGWLTVLGTLAPAAVLPFLYGANVTSELEWFSLGPWHFTLSLRLDGLGWWLATLVVWVSLAVNVYALRYMAQGDARARVRFHAWMAFFVASMLTLVLAGSLLLLFLAWEGVGLASFALIAQGKQPSESRRAAVKALLMTRLGDFGFLLGWLLALSLIGTTDISSLVAAARGGMLPEWAPLTLAMLFLAAALGKSAQLPLTAWLPDAMAGPTPVSALIHSATMVAAGVYLVLRLFPLFQTAPPALDVVLWAGGVTALFAAVAATAQADLKRVLAWSTVSQLGEMFVAIGLAAPIAATLHLTTHAAFKACLFLGAGAIEHSTGSHEFAQLGRLYPRLPWAALAFVVAALALAGLPPLAGFFSEGKILEAAEARHAGWAIALLVSIALAGTYIGRAAMAAFGPWTGGSMPSAVAREARRVAPPARSPRIDPPATSWTMRLPMLALAAAAASLGWIVGHSAALPAWLFEPLAAAPPSSPEPPQTAAWAWTAGAIVASMGGLCFGAWRVRRGPQPALGAWAGRVSQAADGVVAGVCAATRSAAALCNSLESGFDRLAGGIAKITLSSLSSAVSDNLEGGLDRLGGGAAKVAMSLATSVRHGEDRGVWAGNDRLARAFGHAGARLRRLESGKIFLYSAGVFAWAVLAFVTIGLAAWLT